ncbi:DUF4870 family protein [Paludibacterium paludis]|uniref:Membrane protein n=1 Tax=Paludibacterium paludis TaxID=1225769 RepID=A0A918NZX3_9NEIS|nr:hypothetical protein [Paludibacterium paludis]GGY08599.1 membrane protein [Paludibacterium paludis]
MVRAQHTLSNLTLAVYVLQAVALVTGIGALIGLAINYLKRDEVRGTIYDSHFHWQIRTFWGTLAGGVVGWVSMWMLVGFVLLFILFLWYLYRIVKGFLYLNAGKPMPV